jgi:hypothetical protein
MEPQIPGKLKEALERDKLYEETKSDVVYIKQLVNRLQTCREQRSQNGQTNSRDLKTVEHFQFLFDQQQKELQRTEESMAVVLKQFEQKKQTILQKQLYVEEKLQKAKDRLDEQKNLKGKDEMNLEKQIKDKIDLYDKKGEELARGGYCPWGQLEIEAVRKLLGSTPPLPPTHPPIPPPPVEQPPPKPKVKRGVRVVEDRPLPVVVDPVSEPEPQSEEEKQPIPEEPPITKMTNKQIESLSEAEMFSILRPDVKNPYSNVIQNSKQKRGVKKTSC